MKLLRELPQVDKFIKYKEFESYSPALLSKIAKEVITDTRNKILEKKLDSLEISSLIQEVSKKYEQLVKPSLQEVINATGVIVHTNLGRSLIDPKIFDKAKTIATAYNNLEYDLEKGKRGERYAHITKVLTKLTGCEDAIVVNNNASAVFLVLNTFAKNKEVVVSRGELVEIGGSFRVPDVMEQSGALLKEIGTTNKTHLSDYENAINDNTSMLMKVHKSNYSIEGFTSEVSFEDVIEVAQDKNLIDYYDMGSGHMVDLPYGLDLKEPSILKYMKAKPSLMSFSGDKLLGSVQAGIIIGKKELIDKLKKNQLLRMLRVDKITLAILEENIKSVLLGNLDEIPTLKMLFTSTDVLKQRALSLQENLLENCQTSIIETTTVIGGGTTPNQKIPTIALSLQFKNYKPNKIEKLLRAQNLVGRIEKEQFLLDFRTINENDIKRIQHIINTIAGEK